MICIMEEVAGFVDGALIKRKTSQTVAITTFHHFFVPNILTRIVIVDYGSTFKWVVIALCKLIQITCTLVTPENHILVLRD